MRVLIVDDAGVSRAAFATMAAAAGHLVVAEAVDLDAGLAAAATVDPDVIVVDGRIPPEGAVAFVMRLRAAGSVVPVVIVAALQETALVRMALEAGATGILLRPFVPSRVAAALGV